MAPASEATASGKKAEATKSPADPNAKQKVQREKPKQQPKRIAARGYAPYSFYGIKENIKRVTGHRHFPDSLATAFTLASVAIAFPFLPPWLLAILIVVTFVVTMIHPLAGLMVLLFETFPMLIYQAPLLAWLFMVFIAAALFVGYRHYRTVTFIYMLVALPLSWLGWFLEIPAFLLATLFIGFRRSLIAAAVTVVLVIIVTGLTGVQNTAPIAYNASAAHATLAGNPASAYFVPNKPPAYQGDFFTAWSNAFALFTSTAVTQYTWTGFALAGSAFAYALPVNVLTLLAWLLTVFAITHFAVWSRSAYKGAESSLYGAILPASYSVLSYTVGSPFSIYPILSFIATPIAFLVLELNGINIVRVLEVMKEDFLGKFGGVIEDISVGAKETLADVANYEETKRELREAILAPIEHREITGAYGVGSTKGILLFGPPGTGKTLIMRALANEIRAGFYYVKASSILSPYAGESAQAISRIFATCKKHAPAVLFFDEIDSIAGSREVQTSDTGRQMLSALLSEMDGFQKIEGVVIVGATNVPNILDPSIMRPGRFDKIIYMPLPDDEGREEIFRMYLKRMPVSKDISYGKLAELTKRFSGADIKAVCDEVKRHVAEEAVEKRAVLQIGMADIVNVIKNTKPSTSLSMVEDYQVFKMDYERRAHPELPKEREEKVSRAQVIGLKDAKKALYDAVEVPLLHPDMIKKYDIDSVKGVLMFGPPGVGKTLLVKALANDLGDVHVFTLSGSDLSKEGLDHALYTIKQAFNRAKENTPSILFIDEMDALVPSRDTATEFGVQVTGEFLQELDGMLEKSGVIVIGATNRPDAMDSAILRAGRFDKLVFTPPPDASERILLFKEYLQHAPLAADMDYGELSRMTVGFTGADIANVCRQTKLEALERALDTKKDTGIEMADLKRIIQSTRPSAPSIVIGRYMTFLSRFGSR